MTINRGRVLLQAGAAVLLVALICVALAWCSTRVRVTYTTQLQSDPWGEAYVAVRDSQPDWLETALASFPDFVTRRGESGYGLVHWAAHYDCSTCFDVLVRHGADVNEMTGPYDQETTAIPQTPLHIAIREGSWNSGRTLVRLGASLDIVDGNGVSPRMLLDALPEDELGLRGGAE